MTQSHGDYTEPSRTARLRYVWEHHRTTVVVVSCLVLPFIFVPVWLVVFGFMRLRSAFGRPGQRLPRHELPLSAVVPEARFVDAGKKAQRKNQPAYYVGVSFKGLIAIVGVMLCALGFEVIGLASGQPGGGIALLMGYCLLGGGVIAIIIGVVGFFRDAGRKDR